MSNEHQYGGTPRPSEETRNDGRQTPQQAAITGQGGAGKTDADRNAVWRGAGGEPGRSPVAVGGSSQGQSDQNDGRSADEDKGADGLYRSERTGGRAATPMSRRRNRPGMSGEEIAMSDNGDKPERDAGQAARDLGQPEGSGADPAAADPEKSPPRNPSGLSSGLQPGGTIPGKSPGAGVGSIGTGGGSTGGNATGTTKRGS